MKILFFGDSVTDAKRNRESSENDRLGTGYVMQIAGSLCLENPMKYEIVNRGNGGERIVDLYARIKLDVWNEKPDVLTIFEGINDISHEIYYCNGVELERWAHIYRTMLEETKMRLPNTKIIVVEPIVLHGEIPNRNFAEFEKLWTYRSVLKQIAKEYGAFYLSLQSVMEEKAGQYGDNMLLFDGVHPTVYGAKIIAEEWLKLFYKKIQNER